MEIRTATKIVGGNPSQHREKADFYPTPPDVTIALLKFMGLPKETVIWEPACGEMDMVSVMKSEGYSVIATDLKYGQDFLTMPERECDWIITNPPFSAADKFIARCAAHRKPFALLLKSQYWHAKKRYDLFQKVPPAYVLPLTWRPDFMFKKHDKRSAPLMDVMWCIWIPPYINQTMFEPLEKEYKNKGKKENR